VRTTENRFASTRFFYRFYSSSDIERGANVLFCNKYPDLNVPIKPVDSRNNSNKNAQQSRSYYNTRVNLQQICLCIFFGPFTFPAKLIRTYGIYCVRSIEISISDEILRENILNGILTRSKIAGSAELKYCGSGANNSQKYEVMNNQRRRRWRVE